MNHLQARIEGRAGRLTLARPEALNALAHEMSLALAAAVEAWADDDAVAVVIIDAEGDRAFCAGGDVRRIWHSSRAGDPAFGRDFWRQEYRLNARLAAYPKPVVSLMQGFVMGGGVGVGCHVSHRVLDPGAEVAMPESAIGFLPDVGGSLLLARAPDRIGVWMALTALRLGAADAIHAGFADHVVPRAAWPGLIAELCAGADPGILEKAAVAPAPGPMASLGPEIAAAFAGDDLAVILARLAALAAPWAEQALQAIRRNSPLSMASALALIGSYGADDDVPEALRREYRFTWRSAEDGVTDFQEGVRAQLIDKDRTPQWRYGSVEAVPAQEVAALLAPLAADDELRIDRDREVASRRS